MVVAPAEAGVQNPLFFRDSGFRRNDGKARFAPFYERINLKKYLNIPVNDTLSTTFLP
jgi:hypothetical protein